MSALCDITWGELIQLPRPQTKVEQLLICSALTKKAQKREFVLRHLDGWREKEV